ncbi:MAG TPA: hypothetical protein VFH60_10600, partial [Chloroflexia bacterium]|nr:hypothetical protein [Chloroflexia bacterium]
DEPAASPATSPAPSPIVDGPRNVPASPPTGPTQPQPAPPDLFGDGADKTTFLRGTGPLNPDVAGPSANELTAWLPTAGTSGYVGSTGNTGPLLHTGPLRTGPFDQSVLAQAPGQPEAAGTGKQTPRGALELLPQESVAFQLGALYLTTKRVILLAPSVIRSAFIRDIDAVGTFTERASGWFLFGSVLMLAGAGLSVYLSLARTTQSLELAYPWLYIIDPLYFGLLLLAGALLTLVRYFFHVKRTLFISVRGRPLITVSIADWNTRKLEGMDSFVNAFFQIKDHMTGELDARQVEGR